MEIIRYINFVLLILFLICYSYQFFYVIVAWFGKRKKAEHAPHNNKYAALICARNESTVIADLVESLKSQTYDQSKLTVFVLADNCTDDTADVAKRAGAVVYTRFNSELVGKGYAMSELLKHIWEDYPKDSFDGFFVFDADNLLQRDYIEQMNDVFAQGNRIVTSYRNSKNIGDNWVSAGIGLWFLRESRYLNYPRSLLKISCAVSGTGFLFARSFVDEFIEKNKDDPWPFHLLTEDLEFSADRIIQGEKIAFADAEFFDEQPISFKQSWNQRKRWSRGYFQVIGKYGKRLTKGLFHGNFACYDMIMNIFPAFFLSSISLVSTIVMIVLSIIVAQNPLVVLESFAQLLFNVYITVFVVGFITTVSEWKHMHTTTFKKIWHAFTFPVFMFTFLPVTFAALLKKKVEWKPIQHTISKKDLEKKDASERIE